MGWIISITAAIWHIISWGATESNAFFLESEEFKTVEFTPQLLIGLGNLKKSSYFKSEINMHNLKITECKSLC